MPRIRFPFAVVAAAALAVPILAGCGSSSGSALDSELSYFPSGSPFVMSIATDPNSPAIKNAQGFLKQFPLASLGETALFGRLAQLGINYNTQIKPLFGNPVAFGIADSALAPGQRPHFLLVWITKDAGALNALVKKLGLQMVGSGFGATVYQGPSLAVGVQGSTLLLANSSQELGLALNRHSKGGGISSDTYNQLVSGLPQDSLVQAAGTLSGLLSTLPGTAKARRIPWVAALRGYGVTINVNSAGTTIQYRLDTSATTLTDAQLPIPSGAGIPTVAGGLPVAAGLSDPGQLIRFVESAEQVENPASYGTFLAHQARTRLKTGVDLSTLVSLVSGQLAIESNGHTTLLRTTVSDPVRAGQTLAKLASDPKDVLPHAKGVTPAGAGFYAITTKNTRRIVVGVAGNELVAGNATPARLRLFALAPAVSVPGARGAAVFRIALARLVALALRRGVSPAERNILNVLGNVSGWVAASPSAMVGSATLSLR